MESRIHDLLIFKRKVFMKITGLSNLFFQIKGMHDLLVNFVLSRNLFNKIKTTMGSG